MVKKGNFELAPARKKRSAIMGDKKTYWGIVIVENNCDPGGSGLSGQSKKNTTIDINRIVIT